jgi:hypothetical protein
MPRARQWSALTVVLVFAACGDGNGNTPTNPSPPPSTPTTLSLTGRVTETPPTQTIAIVGANIPIADGPNAGRSTTTDVNGNYTLANLQQPRWTPKTGN